MPPIIKVQALHKSYSGATIVDALSNVSFNVLRGEFIAIMGPSGSGKSTLMNVLGCLDRPTRGRYELDGEAVEALNSDKLAALRNCKLSFVFQKYNLLSRTTAIENVELPMLCYGRRWSAQEVRARAAASLARVGLSNRIHHFPYQLSGGQQQRVAIARALVNDAQLILADEPTGNLDTKTSIEIMCIFQDLNEMGTTIVMVTHDSDIARHATRNIVMRDGRIVKDVPVLDRLHAAEELAQLGSDGNARRCV